MNRSLLESCFWIKSLLPSFWYEKVKHLSKGLFILLFSLTTYFSANSQTAQMDLCVDMSCLPGSITAPSVFGTFNGWDAGANMVTDPDGDGVYCTVVPVTMPIGNNEFKFFRQEGEETFAPGSPCTVTSGPFTNRLFNVPAGGGLATFGWNDGCENGVCVPPPAPNVTICVDMSCLGGTQAPSVFGSFNGWNAGANMVTDPDGDGIYCADIIMAPGLVEFKFFDQLQGEETLMPNTACTNAFTNREITVPAVGTLVVPTIGWESCDATCTPPPPGPDLVITFDDPAIDYELSNFGGMNSNLAVDPLNPPNMVMASTKPAGAACWAGTVVGNSCLDNPIPFTATDMTMTMRVFSPVVGAPMVLKVENCNNAAIASEALAFTTVANAWETLAFDFSTACPVLDLNQVFSKVVVFAEFTCENTPCGTTGLGDAPASGLTYFFDNIMMCDGSMVPVIACPADLALEGCDVSAIADATLPNPTPGPYCDQPQGSAGFSGDGACEAAVCANDGFCCSVEWDGLCAGDAATNPACSGCLSTISHPAFSTTPVTITEALFVALGGQIIDDCNPVTVTYVDVQAGTCPIVINRIYTVTDSEGNIDACNQTINIDDSVAPALTCPATADVAGCSTADVAAAGLLAYSEVAVAITEADFTGEGGLVVEDCNVAGGSYIDVSAGECPIVVTRTYTLTDDCGNPSSCTQTINVGDSTFPDVNGAMNMTVACDGTGNADALAAWLASNGGATATDDCGVVWSNNFVGLTDGCGATGVAEVTFSATDPCGNTATTTATFSITDTEGPVVTCPPAQGLNCFEGIPDPATTPADFIAMGGTIQEDCTPIDQLQILSTVSDNGGTNCPLDALIVTRTYTIIDDCGNGGTCEQVFTYAASDVDPVITSILPTCYKYCGSLANPMASDVTYTTDCNFGATVGITGPTVIGPENCPGTIYRYTYIVTDDCGRDSEPVTRDFIIGNDGPTIECAPFNLILECGDANNQDYIDAHIAQVSANSSCELGLTINHFPQNFNLISCGSSTVVTFVATDDCGRTATCTTTIAVQDNTPPTITTVPPSICDAAECGGNVDYWFDHWVNYMLDGLEATDECDTNVSFSTIPSNPQLNTTCDPVSGDAVTTVTFVANDNCGNTATHVSTFTVENEFPASFENVPADATVDCTAPIVFGPSPTATNTCQTTITFDDTVNDSDPCAIEHTRIWTATDACGGLTTTAAQTITAVDNTGPVVSGGADETVECDGAGNLAELDAWLAANGGTTATDDCNTPTLSNDYDPANWEVNPTCTGGIGAYVDVTFSATDNCGNVGNGVTLRFNIADTTPPNAPAPPADVNVQCADDVPAPVDLTATDECSGDITVSPSAVITPGNCDNQFTMVRTWTFTDLCGNQSAVSQTITVDDTTPPDAPAPPADVNVQCADDVPAPVDLTANDNCDGDIIVSPSAVITPGNCDNQFTMVRTWTFVDGCGNQSSVSQTITVDDTTPPDAPAPPADVNVQCASDVPAPVDLTGNDNCDGDITVSPSAVITPGNCDNQFTMVRTWTFVDGCGNQSSVSQTITVDDTTPPDAPAPPADVNVQCADDVPAPVDLTANDNCDGDITVSPSAVITPGNCDNQFTMVRTWTFVDGCGNQSSVSQTITVDDTTDPVFTFVPADSSGDCGNSADFEDATADDNCGGNVTITHDDVETGQGCAGSVTRTWTATDACGNTATASSTITYSDDEAPEFTYVPGVADVDCDDDLTPEAPQATDNCGAVTVEITDTDVNGTLCDNGYAANYTWTATDECGNTATVVTTVWVNPDVEGPEFTFVPEGDLITCDEFPPTFGEPVVEEACGDYTLTFIDEYIGNENGCDDGENFDYRRVWTATDDCGNTSTAKQTFWVKAEGPTANVMGIITTEMDDTVEDVEVTIEGGTAGYSDLYQTADNGEYSFADLPVNNNYSITPYHNENPLNGVSTYDLVLISQHILTVNSLDSPYKMIAADINKSGSITTLDLVELRKMILFINTEFQSNTSWRFVEAEFVFPIPTNPFATTFPEVTNINNLTEDEQHDFIGVKIGDVNGSVIANSLNGIDDRTFNGDLRFNTTDKMIQQGETYEVVFTAEDFNAIAGYQYTLNFNAEQLEFVELNAGDLPGIDEANFGLSNLSKGSITTSWSSNEAITLKDDTELFSITFKAKQTTQLSEAIAIGSRLTRAEAYDVNTENGQLNLLNVDLRFDGLSGDELPFALLQNTPNPFRNETSIGFMLPQATTATLTIFDATGRQLKQISGDYEAGYNEVSLNRSDLANGILYYQLETSTQQATRKMMLISE